MQEAQNWRELLAIIINDPREKSRITEALGVTPITIARWVSGESEPRLQNLRQLLAILPQYRSQFLELLKKERDIKEFISSLLQDSEKDIPSGTATGMETPRLQIDSFGLSEPRISSRR